MAKFTKISKYIFYLYLLTYENCYIFSVIIPIYNAARYLNDSIESIINQTIGFKNIQLILVNDGSTDKTEEICLYYKNKYKENIFYINIRHGGASKARNVGFKYANGTYINFLDCDDKWDKNAFKYILLFFEFYKNINYVAGRIKIFEAMNIYHPLDYKFYQTRIVNLSKEYNCIQLQASSSVFKKSILKGKLFEENIVFSEDTKLINKILLINPLMGVIKEAIYYYRRRNDFSSAIQNKANNLFFYFGTVNSVLYYFINKSKKLYNKIVPFIQFLLGYEILYRLQTPAYKYLDSNNFEKYKHLIDNIIKQIEDKYILEQKILSNKYKLFLLSKKYNKDLRYQIRFEKNSLIYLNYTMINLTTESHIFSWKKLNIKNNILYIEALDNIWLPKENYYYYCKAGNKIFFPKYVENFKYNFFTLYGLIEKGRTIIFEIPFETNNLPLNFYFYISYLGYEVEIFPSLGVFTHIPNINNGYYINDDLLIKYIEKRIVIFKYNIILEKESEIQYCKELKKVKKDDIIRLREKYIKKRNKYNKQKLFEIWIINDEQDRAGGNGEYFYRYLKLKNPKGIKPFFAILKDSPDYIRLKKLGGILDINSFEYKNNFLQSNKIISSVYNTWFYNPFNKEQIYIRDLLNFDIIYLQNGILKDDFSNYINKYDKNFNLIVTSSKYEYKYIINKKYGYNENDIILTGMPKYDNLKRIKNFTNLKNALIIIPTWRKTIKRSKDILYNISNYLDNFKDTKFFEFYNKLINDNRLHLIMKKFNYTGVLCLHPIFENQWIDFKKNEIITVYKNCNFQNLLLESSLLITDYSDIFFEFAYIKKPIIYTHFDYEEYRLNHYDAGYFDYNKNGFGPICKDINCTVNEISFEIENDFILRKKYLNRIKRFFAFFDQNNSERIFYEISKSRTKSKKSVYKFFLIFINITIIISKIKLIIFNTNSKYI